MTLDQPIDRGINEPHVDRLPVGTRGRDVILAAHAEAIARGDQGYADPFSGLFVQTAASHLERGSCCDQGCRHCPYL